MPALRIVSSSQEATRAARFERRRSQNLNRAHEAGMQVGASSWFCSFWVKLRRLDVEQVFASKWLTATDREWRIYWRATDQVFAIDLSSDGTTTGATATAEVGATPYQVGVWYHIRAGWTSDDTTAYVIVSTAADGQISADNTASFADGCYLGTAPFRLGGSSAADTHFGGEMALFGLWKGLHYDNRLNLLQTANLKAGITYAEFAAEAESGAHAPLDYTNTLVAYWNLDEAGGVRFDSSPNARHLDTNFNTIDTPGSSAGLRAGATRRRRLRGTRALAIESTGVSGTSQKKLTITGSGSDADFQTGSRPFFTCGWVRVKGPGNATTRVLLAKYTTSGNQREWIMQVDHSTGKLTATYSTNGTATGSITTDAAAPLDTWAFCTVYYDGDKITVSLNNGPFVTSASIGALHSGTADVTIGDRLDNNNAGFHYLSSIGYWRDIAPDRDFVTALYNDGLPLPYGELTDAQKVGLVSYWDLDEWSGTRYDRHGDWDAAEVGSLTPILSKASLEGEGRLRALSGHATRFDRSKQQALTVANNTSLALGGTEEGTGGATSFTVCGWVKFLGANPDQEQPILSKYGGSAPNREFLLYKITSPNTIGLIVTADGTSISGGGSGGTIAYRQENRWQKDRWYFVRAGWDAATKETYIQINNGQRWASTDLVDNTWNSNAPLMFGGRQSSTSTLDGELARWGYWKRTLTDAEATALYEGGLSLTYQTLPTALHPNLLTSMVSFWNLDEASGTRADSHSTNHLAETNGPLLGVATGEVALTDRRSARIQRTIGQHLTAADHADLSMGDVDFTIAAWVKFEEFGSTPAHVLSKGTAGADANNEFKLYMITSTSSTAFNRFRFAVGDGSSSNTATPTLGPPQSVGKWHFVVAWHDSTQNQINLQVDDGPLNTPISHAIGSQNTNGTVNFGASVGGGSGFNGSLGPVAIWKGRVLTQAERTALFNRGRAVYYADLPATLKTNLSAYWDMDEVNGNRVDRHNGHVAVPTATVAQVTSGSDAPVSGRPSLPIRNGGAALSFPGRADCFYFRNDATSDGGTETEDGFGKTIRSGDFDQTWAGWIKIHANRSQDNTQARTFFSREGEITLQVANGNVIDGIIYHSGGSTQTVSSTTVLRPGRWHFVAISFNEAASEVGLSVNGHPYRVASVAGAPDTTTGKLAYGGLATGGAGGQVFPGAMARWGKWNRLLTQTELIELMNDGKGKLYAELSDAERVRLISYNDLAEFLPADHISGYFVGPTDGTGITLVHGPGGSV